MAGRIANADTANYNRVTSDALGGQHNDEHRVEGLDAEPSVGRHQHRSDVLLQRSINIGYIRCGKNKKKHVDQFELNKEYKKSV